VANELILVVEDNDKSRKLVRDRGPSKARGSMYRDMGMTYWLEKAEAETALG
jgi:hypothetical protein